MGWANEILRKRTDRLISNVLPNFITDGLVWYVAIFLAFRKI